MIHRKSCRALLLTPDHEILLIKVENPEGHWAGWITPGGGLNPGENEHQGLRRELVEELGHREFSAAVPVWTRKHEFPWKKDRIAQAETFFLIHTARFSPRPEVEDQELFDLKEFRWWSLTELKQSNENFAPRRLPEFLEQLIRNGPPRTPLDVGV